MPRILPGRYSKRVRDEVRHSTFLLSLVPYAKACIIRLNKESVYLWTLPMFHACGWTYPWANVFGYTAQVSRFSPWPPLEHRGFLFLCARKSSSCEASNIPTSGITSLIPASRTIALPLPCKQVDHPEVGCIET